MSILATLTARSSNQCELCQSTTDLSIYDVPPAQGDADKSVLTCQTCHEQLSGVSEVDANHWRCLGESMWSAVPAVQVTAYRQLHTLSDEDWAKSHLEMLYLADEVQAWADEGLSPADTEQQPTLDTNGVTLQAGDNVTIIKDLQVKGAGFTAKRGTAVRNISLTNDPTQIEGRVNGQRIVLLTQFLKKL